MQRTILHIDINGCYASIECLHNPIIRNKPVAVGGDVKARHGIILAKNEYAKKFGIKTGEALWQAKQKCPQLVIVPPNYDLYLRFSRLTRQIYEKYTDRIEPFGLDEAWLDVSGSQCDLADGEKLADEIRRRIKFELGITVSVGVSYNKVFAKLGSDYKKPDAVTVFSQDNFRQKVWPLPVEQLLYVGRATGRKLTAYGVYTIGQLAQTDLQILKNRFGKWGVMLYRFANGQDHSAVACVGNEAVIKSIGNSTTTPRDLYNEQDAKIVFYMLAESVAERLREAGFRARTVQIGLRDRELHSFERQLKLNSSTCLAAELHKAAMHLLRANYNWSIPLRSIGLRACDLIPATEPKQFNLFIDEPQNDKQESLEKTVDEIRRRFGHYAICRAVTKSDKTLKNINPKDEHVIHPVGLSL